MASNNSFEKRTPRTPPGGQAPANSRNCRTHRTFRAKLTQAALLPARRRSDGSTIQYSIRPNNSGRRSRRKARISQANRPSCAPPSTMPAPLPRTLDRGPCVWGFKTSSSHSANWRASNSPNKLPTVTLV